MSSTFTKYFITHGRGLNVFVEKELLKFNNHNHNPKVKIDNENSIEGKILFSTNVSIGNLYTLKTVERAFLNVLFLKLTGTEKLVELFASLNESLREDLFLSREFSYILNQKNELNHSSIKKKTNEKKYRINCKLTGKWKHEKNNLKEKIINIISEKLKLIDSHFQIDLENPDFEIICHLTDVALSCGVPISKKPLSNREYIQYVGLRSTIVRK
jgi:23S rRNA G2445 N2-methylase RlmL